jgi:hypothetical protein
MARKEHGNGASYQLVKGRKENVGSNVYTLKFPDANGKDVVIDASKLKNGDGKYLYSKTVSVPCIESGVTDENIGERLQQFTDDLRVYDAADEIVSMDGTKRGARHLTLCVNEKGEPISASQYVARLLNEAHRLAIQKRIYKPLREKAIADFRASEGIEAPARKVRAQKAQEAEGEEVFEA